MSKAKRLPKFFKVPQQHGAWAFLIVPNLTTALIGSRTWLGWLFFATWICAYPLSYFLTAAAVVRFRRGKWSARAKRELRRALLWAGLTALGGVVLTFNRPWIFVESIFLLIPWSLSIFLAITGRERGITNDLLLVAMASLSPILMYQVTENENSIGAVPSTIWQICLITFLFFAGTVLHVKALIREANNRQWHFVSSLYHLVVLLLLAIIWHSWLISAPFFVSFIRTLLVRPGLSPKKIGLIEGLLAVLLVVTVAAAKS